MTSSEDFIPEDEPPIVYRCYSCGSEFTEEDCEPQFLSVWVRAHLRREWLRNNPESVRIPDGVRPDSMDSFYASAAHCDDCCVECYTCGDASTRDDVVEGLDEEVRCPDCHYELHSSCESCSETIWSDDAYSSEHGDAGPFCSECYRDYEDEYGSSCRLIEGYCHTTADTDGRFVFRNSLLDNWKVVSIAVHRRPVAKFPYIGFELETNIDEPNRRGEAAEFLMAGVPENYMVLKEDGSINGFEIVTFASDYHAHMELFPWDKLPLLGSQYTMRSWQGGTNCGLHVHISKSAFSSSHTYKFMKFHDHNEEVLKRLAGRTTNYATFGCQSWESRKEQARGRQSTERYVAVNTNPRDTYELRYFRGSLKPATVKGVLEFTHSLWKYTGMLTVGDVARGSLEWGCYRDFVEESEQREAYPHLVPLLNSRNT